MFSLTACEDWLDITPKSQIKADKLFETEDGFKDALVGIYIGLTDDKAYGQYLTWHILENFARQYDVSNGIYGDLQMFNYEEGVASDVINDIWLKQYNIIAEINKLLEALEESEDVLNPTMHNVIKGEALALRALCHLDLIRLFGHGNHENRPDLANRLTIPYVTKHTKHLTGQKSYAATFALMNSDIEQALELLKSDPYYTGEVDRPDDYEDIISTPFFEGTFLKGRETRINYGAVLALKARAYMWQGDKEKALLAAEDCIAAINYYINTDINQWATESWGVGYSNEKYRDQVFYFEQLFCLDVGFLKTYISDYYESHLGGNWNNDRLICDDDFISDIYDIESGEGLSDLRYVHQLQKEGSSDWLTIKVRKTTGDGVTYFADVIPMLKISEPYLIAAECYMDPASLDKGKAIEYLNLLKAKRNIPDTYFIQNTITDDDLNTVIYKEYRKEFIQEGQLFYYYKRKGLETYPGLGSVMMTDQQYVLPYPDIEVDLGGRDQ